MNKPIERCLELPEVKMMVSMGKTAIYQGMKAGTFPKARKQGPKKTVWLESEITGYIQKLPVAGEELIDDEL
jgi:prophage regulatory protein